MARKPRNTVPTSVILTHEQKALIKGVAEKESRTFSHQLRFILMTWCDQQKERRRGKESEKAGEEGQKGQEVDD